MKRAFTLVELLVVIAIVLILAALIVPLIGGGCSADPNSGKMYYSVTHTENYQCVKTYTVAETRMVDLRPVNGETTSFEVVADNWAGVYDASAVYSKFEAGKWYSVESVGFRQVATGPFTRKFYPRIKNATEIRDPRQ